MPTLNGNFYFRRTSNGNLIGEFSNDKSSGAYTESADCIGANDGFVGTYHSSWQEKGQACFAELAIGKKNATIYTLKWNIGNGKGFSGQAMLVDEMLIGNYTDF